METHFLGRLPAYGLLKSLSNDVIAPGETADHPVVLVRFDDAWQLGILMGPAAEGTPPRGVRHRFAHAAVRRGDDRRDGARARDGDSADQDVLRACRRAGLGLGEMVRLQGLAS